MTNAQPSTSPNDSIVLPLHAGGYYDFTVNWGDGSEDHITAYNQSEVTHQYSSTGSTLGPATNNICMHRRSTQEFNGKSGIVDLVRFFNLTTEEAIAISDHFPVWAEFRTGEGGRPNRFANRKTDLQRSK